MALSNDSKRRQLTESEKQKIQKQSNLGCAIIFFGVLIIFVICIIVAMVIFKRPDGGSSSSHEDKVIEMGKKEAECDKQTNAYYKCSYSVHEERCVCKQR